MKKVLLFVLLAIVLFSSFALVGSAAESDYISRIGDDAPFGVWLFEDIRRPDGYAYNQNGVAPENAAFARFRSAKVYAASGGTTLYSLIFSGSVSLFQMPSASAFAFASGLAETYNSPQDFRGSPDYNGQTYAIFHNGSWHYYTSILIVPTDIIGLNYDALDVTSHASYSNPYFFKDGYSSGFFRGSDFGYDEGYVDGELAGYDQGYQEAVDPEISLINIIKAGVEAPFYVIQHAFNFELFGIQIGGLIFGIITAVIGFFVVKLILRIFL